MEMRMLLSDWVANELYDGNWHPPFFPLSIFGIYVSTRVLVQLFILLGANIALHYLC